MELLAPAGSREALEAAVRNGADAVYLGYTAFGARSSAANFDREALRGAIAYAHARSVRVYVTVNTLIKQNEMGEVAELLAFLYQIGADAAIVQDMGVLAVARRYFLGLCVHASTQMALLNAQGVRWARTQGVARVVAARECTAEELASMAVEGVEIEAFVHGALCVAVSGQCLYSSLVGGRSGNRGRCAQPCRLPYRLLGKQGALLSPRDQMLMGLLPKLQEAGVTSLKIEGRMKRAAYVAVVTRAYREALTRMAHGEDPAPDERTLRDLQQIFHRGGFTEGYVGGAQDADLLCPAHPGHAGLLIGRVTRISRDGLAQVLLTDDLHDGDGLQFRSRDAVDCTYAGPDVPAGDTAHVRCSKPVMVGAEVYRLTDAWQVRDAEQREEEAKRPVDMQLHAHPGKVAQLTAKDGDISVTVVSDTAVEAAQNRAMVPEDACKQLDKCGDTPFVLRDLSVFTEGAFMPAAMLNGLRRQVLAGLEEARAATLRAAPPVNVPTLHTPKLSQMGEALLIVRTEHAHEVASLLAAGADIVEWQPMDVRPSALDAALKMITPGNCRFVLPQVLGSTDLDTLHAWICANRERFSGVVLTNPAHLALDFDLPLHADAALPTWNAWTAESLRNQGLLTLTTSPELSLTEVRALTACGGDYALNAYGREALMTLAHCPVRAAKGLCKNREACALCDTGYGADGQFFTDRQGVRFPMRRLNTPHGCWVRLYNSVPTDVSHHVGKLLPLKISFRLSFMDEPPEKRIAITRLYRALLDVHPLPADAPDLGQTTTAHLFRGVE